MKPDALLHKTLFFWKCYCLKASSLPFPSPVFFLHPRLTDQPGSSHQELERGAGPFPSRLWVSSAGGCPLVQRLPSSPWPPSLRLPDQATANSPIPNSSALGRRSRGGQGSTRAGPVGPRPQQLSSSRYQNCSQLQLTQENGLSFSHGSAGWQGLVTERTAHRPPLRPGLEGDRQLEGPRLAVTHTPAGVVRAQLIPASKKGTAILFSPCNPAPPLPAPVTNARFPGGTYIFEFVKKCFLVWFFWGPMSALSSINTPPGPQLLHFFFFFFFFYFCFNSILCVCVQSFGSSFWLYYILSDELILFFSPYGILIVFSLCYNPACEQLEQTWG